MTIKQLSGYVFALALLITCLSTAPDTHAAADEPDAVLITGASSGIGRKTTELLASKGTFVYAGARKQEDLDALNAMDNVEAIRLDVTIQEQIDAAAELIKEDDRTLRAIVNNAGVAVLGPLVEIPESDLDFTFDVNVYGPYRITKTFLPLLLKSKGRVINVSSVSGVQANMLFGTYSMSKHALEAYNDVLAIELQPFGVDVIAIEPGAFGTQLSTNAMQVMEQRGFTVENSLYAQIPWERMQAEAPKMFDWPAPDAVAETIEKAIFAEMPKEHYMIVSSKPVAELTIRKAIEELVRYNEDHEHSFSRDELIKFLDDELSGKRIDLQRFGPPPRER